MLTLHGLSGILSEDGQRLDVPAVLRFNDIVVCH